MLLRAALGTVILSLEVIYYLSAGLIMLKAGKLLVDQFLGKRRRGAGKNSGKASGFSEVYKEVYDRLRELGYSHKTANFSASLLAYICEKFNLRLEDLTPEEARKLAIKLGYQEGSAWYAKRGLVIIREGKRKSWEDPRKKSVLACLSRELGVRKEELFEIDPGLILRELERLGYSKATILKWKRKLLRARGEDPRDWVYLRGELIKIPKLPGFHRESYKFHEIPPRGPERAQMCEIEG